jgi:hypothetical protein
MVALDEIEVRETEEDENGEKHKHAICEWCRSSLPWAIVELSAHGFYVYKGRQVKVAKLTRTDEKANAFAGEWTEDNVDEYPPLAARKGEHKRRERSAPVTRRATEQGDDKADFEALRSFFFRPDPSYRSDGTLAVSMSGREWF